MFAGFWAYALFFASKEAVNRIADEAWARRAEEICAAADAERQQLADLRPYSDDPAALAERAALADRATNLIEGALDDVVAVEPSDEKGRAIVPQWEEEYRRYIADRREYTVQLREGDGSAFSETAVNGIPVSDRLRVFANDNEMPSCAPPYDLSQ